MTDPGVAAVFCIRGGYGSGRLLPWLPFTSLAPHQKIFLGHSDITFLHTAFASQMGWTTFLGPNLVDMATLDRGLEPILKALSAEADFCWKIDGPQVIRDGTATGRLFGGNLTCLVHLLGTPFFPNLDGALLLLEDRGEALYRLDRMLTHLKLAGVIDRLCGLLLGQFTDCDEPERIFDLIVDVLRPFPYPIVAGLPFGHTTLNEVVPLGVYFSLNTYEGFFKAQQTPFRTAA
jgi:muramoyltetrapeptide carboxypeptidase